MRYTLDGWASQAEVEPAEVVTTTRLGSYNLAYPFYAVDAVVTPFEPKIEFLYRYEHPRTGAVWFKNNGRNFSRRMPKLTVPCGRLHADARGGAVPAPRH